MPNSDKTLVAHYRYKNLSLAWPLAINAFLIQSMLIIDTLIVSPLGELPIASLGIATTILAFFLGLQIAIGNGMQLIVGRRSGAGKRVALQQVFIDGAVISMSGAILCFVIIVFLDDLLLSSLSDDHLIREQAGQYLAVAKYTFFANAICQTCTVFLNGQGDTKASLKIYLLEIPINTLASYFFVFGILGFDGLGVVGAAIGSVIAVFIRLSLLIRKLIQLATMAGIKVVDRLKSMEIAAQFKEILPVSANFVALSFGMTIYQLLFSQLDLYSYVAVTIVFPWMRIATHVVVAWAQANSISITQAIGQNSHKHLPIIIDICVKLGMIMAAIVSLAMFIFSQAVGYIYTNVHFQTLAALAVIAPLYIILPLVRTYNTICGNSLRAMGKSTQVLILNASTMWLFVLPCCALFILYIDQPLFWAFALLPLEELIKALPFNRMLGSAIREQKAM